MVSANNGSESQNCPVLKYNGYTYWAWSDANNDVSMAIVAYDDAGTPVKQWNKSGARYIWQINVDTVAQTVGFVGQSNATITMSFDDLFIPAPGPSALTFVDVGAPAINCIFAPSCTVTPTDTVADIPLPPDVSGTGRLQTRTFTGAPGTPAAGKTAYLYRVDMTDAVSGQTVPCVTDLAIEFGAVTRLSFDGTGQPYDAFVITSGGLGTIGLFNAAKQGNVVDLVFERPVCAGSSAGTGHSSSFVGLVSANAPMAITAHVGWPGLLPLGVDARAPTHATMGLAAPLKSAPPPKHHIIYRKVTKPKPK